MAFLELILLQILACSTICLGQGLRYRGHIPLVQPGFLNIYTHQNPANAKEKYSLLVSSFDANPVAWDGVYFLEHVGKYLGTPSTIKPKLLTSSVTWPREPSQIDPSVFGFDAVSQPDGFLLIGKNYGAIRVIHLKNCPTRTNCPTYDISTDPLGDGKDWFYHRVIWKDVDKDGDPDALTCRARVHVITGKAETQFMWFENPGGSKTWTDPWKQRVLTEQVSDTFSIQQKLNAGGKTYEAIFTVGYFTKKLAVYWTTDPNGKWNDPKAVQHKVIDTGGKFFDLQVADINKDGRLDLLVTINAETNGKLVVYEIPSDFRTGTYKKRVLATGFNSRSGMMGGGAPGTTTAFYPDTRKTNVKPYILLSGDDEGTAYYFTPKSQLASDWSYTRHVIKDEGEENIVGKMVAVDADGDGKVDIFVPSYFNDKIYVYSF